MHCRNCCCCRCYFVCFISLTYIFFTKYACCTHFRFNKNNNNKGNDDDLLIPSWLYLYIFFLTNCTCDLDDAVLLIIKIFFCFCFSYKYKKVKSTRKPLHPEPLNKYILPSLVVLQQKLQWYFLIIITPHLMFVRTNKRVTHNNTTHSLTLVQQTSKSEQIIQRDK